MKDIENLVKSELGTKYKHLFVQIMKTCKEEMENSDKNWLSKQETLDIIYTAISKQG